MSKLPSFGDAGDSVDEVKQHSRNLIPWLPDPHTCDCGTFCEAKTEYVESQAIYMDVWVCPSCGKRYFRDEER